MLKRPVLSGPRATDPSSISRSRGTFPSAADSSTATASSPVCSLTDGCHNRLMPDCLSSSNHPELPLSSTDIVQPPQLAPCSQRTLTIPSDRLIDRSSAFPHSSFLAAPP